MSNDDDWKLIVKISIGILLVILAFKFLFWISLIVFISGIVWLIIEFNSFNGNVMWPIIIIVIAFITGFIGHSIGYGFEKTETGSEIVSGAETVVDADNDLEEVKQKIEEANQNLTETIIKNTLDSLE